MREARQLALAIDAAIDRRAAQQFNSRVFARAAIRTCTRVMADINFQRARLAAIGIKLSSQCRHTRSAEMSVIDSHHHFWWTRRRPHKFPPSFGTSLARDFTPEDLTPEMR